MHAYFQRWGETARLAALAGAGSAIGEGSLDYLLINPASLAGLERVEASFDYTSRLYGWSDGTSWLDGGVRAGWSFLGMSMGVCWQSRGLADLFQEEQWGGSLAFRTGWETVEGMGVTVKSLRVGYQPVFAVRSNPAFSLLESRALSVDVGLQGRLASGWRYAVGIRDLTQPELGVLGEGVRQPGSVTVGMAWQIDPSWRVLMDPSWRTGMWSIPLGVEYVSGAEAMTVAVAGAMAKPEGGSWQMISVNLGASYPVSLGWGEMQLQYAFVYPLSEFSAGWGQHRFGLSVREKASPLVAAPVVPTSALIQESFLPDPPWCYIALEFPDREWARLAAADVPAPSPQDRHRRAVLATILAGVTAGDAAYQALVTDEPSPFEGAALRMIREIRYGEGEVSARMTRSYRAAAALPDPPPEVWLTLGYVLARQGEWKESLAAYRQWSSFAKSGRSEPGAWHTMAMVALKAPDLTAAESALGRLGDQGTPGPWVKELQGRIFLGRGRPDEALAAFQEVERMAVTDGDRARAKWLQAVALSRAPREGAMDEALIKLGEAELLTADLAVVRAARQRMIDEAVKQWLEEGRVNEERLSMTEALLAFNRVLRLVPDHPQAAVRAARVKERVAEQIQAHALRAQQAMAARNLEQALNEWKLVLDADATYQPAEEAITSIVPALLVKAQDRVREGLFQDAVAIHRMVEEVRPGHPGIQKGRESLKAVFVGRAKSHEQQEEMAKARQAWEEYVKWIPEDPEAKSEILRFKETEQAKIKAYLEEAQALQKKGDLTESLFLVEKALRVNSDSEEAMGFKRQMTQQKGDTLKKWVDEATKAMREERDGEARALIKNILRLEPGHREATQWLADMEGRRSKRVVSLFRSAGESEVRWEPDEALRLLSQLLAIVPDHQGGVELQRKIRERLENAAKHRAEVKDAELKGDIAYGQGRMAEALAAYEKALEWDYYNKELRGKIEGSRKEMKKP